jgi:hypothetical protein
MHQSWVGGSGACAGRVALSDALGLATEVEMVSVGTPVPAAELEMTAGTANTL